MRAFALALLGAVLLTACSESPTSVVPQAHPLPGAKLTSAFGPRSHDPLTGKTLVDGHHDGYDLAAASGTAIRAAKAGRVAFAGAKGGYGRSIVLAHAGGWSTLYGHASRLAVKEGQKVRAGQVIAYVGSTGRSTGPHLHYELRRNGVAVDPALSLASGRPALGVKAVKAAAKPRKVQKKPAKVALGRKAAARQGS